MKSYEQERILKIGCEVLEKLKSAGYEAYMVGGCVRDYLLDNMIKDIDITTNAKVSEVKEVFKDYKTVDTGILFGTVTLIIKNLSIEITTYRIDGKYSDGRHPDGVNYTSNVNKDIRRRDFTINGLLMNSKFKIIDRVGGLADLNARVIKCIGKNKDRFTEDPLRFLRMIRFASQLDFDIEYFSLRTRNIDNLEKCFKSFLGKTVSKDFKIIELLSKVSIERIQIELDRTISECKSEKSLIEALTFLNAVYKYDLYTNNYEEKPVFFDLFSTLDALINAIKNGVRINPEDLFISATRNNDKLFNVLKFSRVDRIRCERVLYYLKNNIDEIDPLNVFNDYFVCRLVQTQKLIENKDAYLNKPNVDDVLNSLLFLKSDTIKIGGYVLNAVQNILPYKVKSGRWITDISNKFIECAVRHPKNDFGLLYKEDVLFKHVYDFICDDIHSENGFILNLVESFKEN
jgi:hypothetical protein